MPIPLPLLSPPQTLEEKADSPDPKGSPNQVGATQPKPELYENPLDTEKALRRFWERIDVRSPDECWPWKRIQLRDRQKRGDIATYYGRFTYKWKYHIATHIVVAIHQGPFDRKLWVLHKCDNPACCNPSHLFLGTNSDNSKDAYRKGRRTSPTTKLNPEKVRWIRIAYADGVCPHEMAKRLGVGYDTIYKVLSGRGWRHVT